jgi:hypothetical protein
MNFMSGAYGPLPPQYPLEVYFSLSVTPRDVRLEFAKEGDRYRYAYDIDFREFKLRYPADTTSFEEKSKLGAGVREVMNRVKNNESLEQAREYIDKLIADLGVAGAQVEITPRRVAIDDTDLDPQAYRMVMTLPKSGGVSDEGSIQETGEDGTVYGGARFVQLFQCRFGTLKAFEDPKVQEAIREQLFSTRLQENRSKVEQALVSRAAIVPERWFKR